jgi:3-hydroxy-4-methylanthranilate adenylyltransferase
VSSPSPRSLAARVDGSAADAPALAGPARKSHAELAQAVRERALQLVAQGVAPGAPVAIQLPPSYTVLEVLLAAWSLDCPVVLLDVRLKFREREAMLDEVRVPVLVEPSAAAPGGLALRPHVPFAVVPLPPRGRELAADVALVQFTSGATGRPKVIARTTASLLEELARLCALSDFYEPTDRVLVMGSLTHSYGLVVGVLQALARGACVLLPASSLGSSLTRSIRDDRATVLLGVPDHYEILLATRLEDMAGVRLAISGGARLREATWRAFVERFGLAIGQSYGMTETGMLAHDTAGAHRGTVGVPLYPEAIRIADGELWVRVAASPYLAGAPDGAYEDGWLRTCDAAELVDGRLVVHGRRDSQVALGGLKVYLGEIEEYLRGHPGVRDAVVVHTDGQLEAFVEADPPLTADALLAACREHLADWKVPRRMVLGPQLPRTTTGKTIRARAALLAALAAPPAPPPPPAPLETEPSHGDRDRA